MVAAWPGLDRRSLAAFRIGLALVLLGELYRIGSQLDPLVGWQWGLAAISLLLTLRLLIGDRTRRVTLASWLLLLGWQQLARYLALPATTLPSPLLQSVLFWAMFLPLGSCYSVDHALNLSPQSQLPPQLHSQQECTGAHLGLILHLLLGLGAGWHSGQLSNGWLLGVISLVLLPAACWEHWATYSPQQLGLTIYYDADCGFCKKVVHLLRTFLVLPRQIPLQTAQSDPVIQTAMTTHNSWVIVDRQGQQRYKWQGMAYVVSLSPVLWPLASVLRWPPLMAMGTRCYEAIANHRRLAGTLTRPFPFRSFRSQQPDWMPFFTGVVVLVMLGTFVNQGSLPIAGTDTSPDAGIGKVAIAILHWITTPMAWLSQRLPIPQLIPISV